MFDRNGFTSNATPAKLAPTGYNPATMKLLRGRSLAKSNAAPATLKFSNLSTLKKAVVVGHVVVDKEKIDLNLIA